MATPISFPGKSTVAQSPTGKFSLVWIEANADQLHQLKLHLANGELRPVMSIERHATVQWAPSGNQFAVSDAFASNESRVLIYSVSEKEGAVAVHLKLPKRVDRLLQVNHHSYIEVNLTLKRDAAKARRPLSNSVYRADDMVYESNANRVEQVCDSLGIYLAEGSRWPKDLK